MNNIPTNEAFTANEHLTSSPYPGVVKAYYRRKEFAYATGMPLCQVDRWLKAGTINSYRVGRIRFIPASELNRIPELDAA